LHLFGAWVGGDHRSVHFRTGLLGEGSKTALAIFVLFMKKILKITQQKTKGTE